MTTNSSISNFQMYEFLPLLLQKRLHYSKKKKMKEIYDLTSTSSALRRWDATLLSNSLIISSCLAFSLTCCILR